MKYLRKSVETIAWFDFEGNTVPLRVKFYNEDQERIVIKVDRIVKKDVDKFAGNKMIRYTCESCIDGEIKLFELRYELDTCKWYLYKI